MPQAPADFKNMANAIRILSMDAVAHANSGHQGMPMGMADIATVLFSEFLVYDPENPSWMGRDRFVVSNGHGSMLLYALLHLTGYDLSLSDIEKFRTLHSKTAGHPEFEHNGYGIEVTTGPLGQGFANGVGMALAQKRLQQSLKNANFDAKTYITLGDGCLMEGISHEAAELAVHFGLNNLILLFDDNGISIDGKTDLTLSGCQKERFRAYGFNVLEADGHDYKSIQNALQNAQKSDKPVFIAFKTEIGYGSTEKKNTSAAHGASITGELADAVRVELNWPHKPFFIPENMGNAWKEAAKTRQNAAKLRQQELEADPNWEKSGNTTSEDIEAALTALQDLKMATYKNPKALATRAASGLCLEAITPHLPQLISGSADLTWSVNTKTQHSEILDKNTYDGNFIHYGIREHAMGAVMNGLALSGLLPVGGTFLSFLDYMKEPVRLAALMQLPSIFVFTHDSIGVGEDGPTHQPIEHLAMLRAIPNLNTFRPADLIETIECWQVALQNPRTPSAFVLSRQSLAPVRTAKATQANRVKRGGYILHLEHEADGILMATGSEVQLAMAAKDKLAEEGIKVQVVSIPCWERFIAEEQAYIDEVLPPHITARVAIEAASPLGWHQFVGLKGKVIGMDTFGASAPADILFKHFGFTVANVVKTLKTVASKKYI